MSRRLRLVIVSLVLAAAAATGIVSTNDLVWNGNSHAQADLVWNGAVKLAP